MAEIEKSAFKPIELCKVGYCHSNPGDKSSLLLKG